MLLVTATSALVIDTRTAILVGHWVEETGGGNSLFVNVIGIISFVVTMVFSLPPGQVGAARTVAEGVSAWLTKKGLERSSP